MTRTGGLTPARHVPEYLMEVAELGLFMVAAALVAVALEHPNSHLRAAIENQTMRFALAGLGMGATAAGLIYSPWGRRSGAHLNPSVTLAFLRLGKMRGTDAAFYVLAQFTGGVLGITVAALLLGAPLMHPAINYVATIPGRGGPSAAFAIEAAMSFGLMLLVLTTSNSLRLARYTGLFVACVVALYITVAAPISGMSLNPARSFGPALMARLLDSLWIYFTAPPLGMLLAAEVYLRVRGRRAVRCAKLHHAGRAPCIFRCDYAAWTASRQEVA